MYHLRTLRDHIRITQAEMALELSVNVNNYAMMERGKRKVPRSLYPAIQRVAEKYKVTSLPVPSEVAEESPAITALRHQFEEQSVNDMKIEKIKTEVQIFKLEKELKRMKKSFETALEFVNSADSQLPNLKENAELRDAYVSLFIKRNRAMAVIKRITKKNPRKIALQIQSLRQQQLLLESAKEKFPEYWLEFKI